MTRLLVVLCVLLFSFQITFPQVTNDAFFQIMEELDISEDNLGFTPRAYWTRYPVSYDIPYAIMSFDDLMAEPQHIYDFIKVMAISAEDFLHHKYTEKNSDYLLKLAFYNGIQHLTSQFRCYNASLWDDVQPEEPLLNAVKNIYRRTNTEWTYNRFGEAADFPLIEKDLRKSISQIDPRLAKIVAKSLYHLFDAWHFRQIAMENIDWQKASNIWRLRLLGETQFDGMEYYPDLEHCAQNIDLNSIFYAGYKILQSSVELSDSVKVLKKNAKDIDWSKQNLNINTPIGRVIIRGEDDDEHRYSDALLVIDLGGNDKYYGAAGSTPALHIPISVCIDFEGDDEYVNKDEFTPSQGAAIFGAALLLDWQGNDRYESQRLSQGSAMLGIGVLADMSGDDIYDLKTSGQGGAYFGVGLLIDRSGDDKYRLVGDGQGYGGVGGAGTLIDYSGNDHYWAEINSTIVNRPDYHSKDGEHNYTYCQGSGVGRRGDITDGHSWAGGIGTLIDIEGDDLYEAGNWSQGTGYWYGMGFLYDGKGNDKYKSTTWSQACGAHFCIGALIDEQGDDEFTIWEQQAAGMGFGHDYTVSLFLNKGGNDKYKLNNDGLGYAINKSQVFFIDTEGDDEYITGTNGRHYGWNNFDKDNPPLIDANFHVYSDQVCIFADIKGKDKYSRVDFETGESSPDSLMMDGATIFYPDKNTRQTLASDRYYGIGKDFSGWSSEEIFYFKNKFRKRFETTKPGDE